MYLCLCRCVCASVCVLVYVLIMIIFINEIKQVCLYCISLCGYTYYVCVHTGVIVSVYVSVCRCVCDRTCKCAYMYD